MWLQKFYSVIDLGSHSRSVTNPVVPNLVFTPEVTKEFNTLPSIKVAQGLQGQNCSILKGLLPLEERGVCTWENHSLQEILIPPLEGLSLPHFFPNNVTFVP